jgi:hypothetical protein
MGKAQRIGSVKTIVEGITVEAETYIATQETIGAEAMRLLLFRKEMGSRSPKEPHPSHFAVSVGSNRRPAVIAEACI